MTPTTAALDRAFATPPGLYGFLTAVNHRAIGLRFVVTSFIFMLLGGILALIMRVQLAYPNLELVSPDLFNQLFTMHGSTMMFLFAVPMMEGIGIYLVPLMIGTRDMAFPRLNAFGYWVYLISGITLYGAFFVGYAPDAGWFNYTPLASPGFAPTARIDFWTTMITFIEVSALVAAVELIVTVFKQRAPGMSLDRLPLFVWAQLVMAFMVVFAMPPIMVTSVLLALDRTVGTHFFHVAAGGEPLLWQHLFWIFGHPDVYIILVPALGIVSAIIPVFAHTRIVGYVVIAAATVALGFLSFGLWVHHMYATGLTLLGLNFFAAASMMVTIPSSLQLFAWVATLWRGRPLVINTAMLYVIGFVVLFILGGITGIMIASPSFDWQVHDTYFIVAHFHYVLVGGAVFPVFAALYFWFPKVTGRLLSERLGRWNFWLVLIGFNATFLPMHLTGFRGMPRRVYTFLPELEITALNLISSSGAFFMALGVLVFLANVAWSLLLGARAGSDPWGGETLEWATSSPPPNYNFAVIPVIRSRHPLWDQAELRNLEAGAEADRWGVANPERPEREIVTTTVVDAEIEARPVLPGPSIWPLFLALSATTSFLGSIVHPWLVVVGFAGAYISALGWLWPDQDAWERGA